LGRDSFKGMGVEFGDLYARGALDILVSNIAAEYALEESHFAFINSGDTALLERGVAPYADRSEALGLSRSDWGWDIKLADFDADGVDEVVQATGFLRGEKDRWPELQELAMGNDELLADPASWPRFKPGDDLSGRARNPFFVRTSSGRYTDIGGLLGFHEAAVSRGIAVADVDGDGRLDLAVANQWGESSFYHNESPGPGAFLGLRLLLPSTPSSHSTVLPGRTPVAKPTRTAIGATVFVIRPDGRRVVAEVDGGNGHSGKRAQEIFFGLGPSKPTSVQTEIRWRGRHGEARSERFLLPPGWHTVLLGGDKSPAEGAR